MNDALEDHDEVDMYALLGVEANPTPGIGGDVHVDDPLSAFMDDEKEAVGPNGAFPAEPHVDVASLLTTLVRDLLDEERLDHAAPGARADIGTVHVHKDREAYHLSLIVDMGGTPIRPFATVLDTAQGVLPLNAPSGLHHRWKPLYDTLQNTLVQALRQHRMTVA
jgi:hypothetical protein